MLVHRSDEKRFNRALAALAEVINLFFVSNRSALCTILHELVKPLAMIQRSYELFAYNWRGSDLIKPT